MPTVLVTGATGGIGLETARVLSEKGYTVLIHGRDPSRGRAAVRHVQSRTGPAPRYLQADFASLAQVRALASRVAAEVPRLDVLINNAGCANLRRAVSEDGYEKTFAVNHLAPFLLTCLLLPQLRAAGVARIVNVASRAHRGQAIDFDDLMCSREYKVMRAYGRSKLANILFTRELARRLAGTAVTANCLHPGIVRTHIGQNNLFSRLIGRLMYTVRGISVEEGARTSLYLATAAEVARISGGYFADCAPAPLLTSPEAVSEAVCQRLWQVSEQLVGLRNLAAGTALDPAVG